jgi:hypothetical protein
VGPCACACACACARASERVRVEAGDATMQWPAMRHESRPCSQPGRSKRGARGKGRGREGAGDGHVCVCVCVCACLSCVCVCCGGAGDGGGVHGTGPRRHGVPLARGTEVLSAEVLTRHFSPSAWAILTSQFDRGSQFPGGSQFGPRTSPWNLLAPRFSAPTHRREIQRR